MWEEQGKHVIKDKSSVQPTIQTRLVAAKRCMQNSNFGQNPIFYCTFGRRQVSYFLQDSEFYLFYMGGIFARILNFADLPNFHRGSLNVLVLLPFYFECSVLFLFGGIGCVNSLSMQIRISERES